MFALHVVLWPRDARRSNITYEHELRNSFAALISDACNAHMQSRFQGRVGCKSTISFLVVRNKKVQLKPGFCEPQLLGSRLSSVSIAEELASKRPIDERLVDRGLQDHVGTCFAETRSCRA